MITRRRVSKKEIAWPRRAVSRGCKLAFIIILGVCLVSLSVVQHRSVKATISLDSNPPNRSMLRACAHVFPQHKNHFANAPHRTFSTFYARHLFEPHTERVLDLRGPNEAYDDDIQDMLLISQNALRRFTGDNSVTVHNYTVGYFHLDRHFGKRYVLHIQSSSSRTSYIRRDVLAFQNTFDGRCSVSVTGRTLQETRQKIYLIVPYFERPVRFQWFLNQFASLRAKGQEIELILSLCGHNETDASTARRLVHECKEVNHIQISSCTRPKFSRATCIREAIKVVSNNSVLFITDIDMYIYPAMFDSCLLNSIKGRQVYFPVFYSLFPGKRRIEEQNGFWRDTSYGMSCMHKSDFDVVGAYEHAETQFHGWGGEDNFLREAFVQHPAYEIFRAVEPALRHKWHQKVCDPTTMFFLACVKMKIRQMGVPQYLVDVLSAEGVDAEAVLAKYYQNQS